MAENVIFAAIGLAHGHITSMCRGLIAQGCELRFVYDDNPELVRAFCEAFPTAKAAESEDAILSCNAVSLIATAAIPSERSPLAIRAMRAGKDVLVDKAPLIHMEEIAAIRDVCEKTDRRWIVYFGESVDDRSTKCAYRLVHEGAIGRVLRVTSSAPHVLSSKSRPAWFFDRSRTGGILIDLACHQVHQFLTFTGSETARVVFARVNSDGEEVFPDFDRAGEMLLEDENGVMGSVQVDWNCPTTLSTWGDPRVIVQGTDGYLDIRKNCDIGHEQTPHHVILVNHEGIRHYRGEEMPAPDFFERVVHDLEARTETAMPLEQALQTMKIAIQAQAMALNKKEYGLWE